MISKDYFCKLMGNLQHTSDVADKIESVLDDGRKELKMDGMSLWGVFHIGQGDILELLEHIFHDASGYIFWWVYECDFGRDVCCNKIFLEEGSEGLVIDSAEKLYDFLLEN
jgi:hypothetical protein